MKKHISNITPAQVEERAAHQKENYPWQIAVNKFGSVGTQDYFNKLK